MTDAVLDADSLRAAVSHAATTGRIDRELADVALEQIDAAPDEATTAQIAFLLDLDEAAILGLAREARSGAPASDEDFDPREEDLVGRELDGFEIVELIGEGGMGRVYRARQPSLRRDVALKVLSAHRLGDGEAVRRFLREGRAAAALNHPRVVTCHGMGRVGDRLYVAMELLTGGDLEARTVRLGGRLSDASALAAVRDACEGLVAIEAAGLVHRDIKPANIFITADGRAKLGDLGLACSRMGDDRVTRTGLVVGTPVYMAPEQAEGTREPDSRADVYALGATLYRLVTGEAPYSGSELAVLRKKLDAPPPDPRKVDPSLSPAIARLIMRAMARNPDDRPADAWALLKAIDDTAVASGARRKELLPAWGAIALAAVIVGTFVVGWQYVQHSKDPKGYLEMPFGMPQGPPPPGAWQRVAMRPGTGSFAVVREGVAAIDPGDEDWRRVGLFDPSERRLPVHARFTLSASASRDSGAGVLAEQGFHAPGGFFHEVGIRGENTEIDAGAQLQRFALWLTLVTDERGEARGLLRAIGPDKPPGQLDLGAKGVVLLDEFKLPGALGGEQSVDVDFSLEAAGWRMTISNATNTLLEKRGSWDDLPPRAQAVATDGPLHFWAHAGNWETGRGRGSVVVRRPAFTRP